MDWSILFAKILGICLIVSSLAVFINHTYYNTVIANFSEIPAFNITAGFINFLIGLVIVISHEVWVYDWRVIITLLGWILLLRGIFLLLFPTFVKEKLARRQINKIMLYFSAFIFLLLGIFLCFNGFFE